MRRRFESCRGRVLNTERSIGSGVHGTGDPAVPGYGHHMEAPRYDEIGRDYAATRREDPQVRDRILAALGDSRTVVNLSLIHI